MDTKVVYENYEAVKAAAPSGSQELYKFHQRVLQPQYSRVVKMADQVAQREKAIAEHASQLQALKWALEDAQRELAREEGKLADLLKDAPQN